MAGLGKNRVYSIGDIETLHSTAVSLFDTGIASAAVWDSEIEKVKELYGGAPIKAAALGGALDSVRTPLCNSEWEERKTWVNNALSSLAGRIPQQDSAGAEALGIMTENTLMVSEMVSDLADCIALAGSSLSLSEYQERLAEAKKQWDGETIAQNLSLFEGKLLGMPGYVAYGADPVNMSTGNFIYQYTDLTTRGKSSLAFIRTYNGMSRKKGILGRGWHHNWEKRIQQAEEDLLILFHEDGREEHFVIREDSGIYESAKSGIRIEKIKDGFGLADTDGSLEQYDENGRLLSVWDKNGVQTYLTYEGEALSEISRESGQYLKMCYNETGELTGITDHAGRKILFAYAGKKLISVTDPEGNSFTYEYGSNGRIMRMLDKRNVPIVENAYDAYRRIQSQKFPDGGVAELTYMDKQNRVKLTRQNGSVVTYIHDNEFRDKKTVYEDGYEEWDYDRNGHVSRRRDKNGNETFYVHDREGRLLETTDALGAKTQNTYDENGRLETVLYTGDTEEHFSYDEEGRLTCVRTKDGEATQLFYEEGAKEPCCITLPDGSRMELSYDKRGNILAVGYPDGTEDTYKYDALDRVTESCDGNGNPTRYEYDGMDRITSVQRADGASRYYTYNPMGEALKVEDFDGYTMHWEYNAINKPSVYTDKQGRQTFMEYDLMWNISRITDPEERVTEYAYDALNRLETVTDPLGRKIYFSYDPKGNRTKISYPDGTCMQYAYDALDRIIKETDRGGRITLTEYDAMGNPVCITDNAGNKTIYEYDKAGREIRETDRTGAATSYTYTALGKTDTITHPCGRVERFYYGPGGRLEKQDKGDGTWEEYRYDRAGNLISCRYPDDSEVSYEYDCLNQVIQTKRNGTTEKKYTYDAMGNMTSMEDAAGNLTQYDYYPSGKLRMVTDPMGGRVLYTYNGKDELTGILQLGEGEEYTFLPAGKEDSRSFGDEEWRRAVEHNEANHDLHLTLFERDKAGRVTTITNALGRKDTYEYDCMDKVVRRMDPEGKETSWEYHPDGQVKSVTYTDGKRAEYSYDALARLERLKDWLGETAFTYDAEGRLIKSKDHNGDTFVYGWNPDGSRDFVEYPDGTRAAYGYDGMGRLTSICSGDFRISYDYDTYGRMLACKRDNGIESRYHYDDAGNLAELIHRDKNGILEEYRCTYDLLGNKTSVTRTSRDSIYNQTQDYIYDPVGRLTEIRENGQLLKRYGYDSYGNRIEEQQYRQGNAILQEPEVRHLTYNAMNQLVTDGKHTYTYDRTGNLASIAADGQAGRIFTYDGMGLLAGMYQNGLQIQTVVNNGMGHRIESRQAEASGLQNGALQTAYGIDYSDPYHRILTERSADGKQHTYLWQDNTLLGNPKEGIYVLPDLFHSPVRATDKEGTTQNLYAYDAFGTIQKKEESLLMPFGFTGYLKEPWEDMYYTGSREYNPVNGSFQSKDQYRYMDYQDPVSINLYTYAKANPLKYLDFDGHESITEMAYFWKSIDGLWNRENMTGLTMVFEIALSVPGLDVICDGIDLIDLYTKEHDKESSEWKWNVALTWIAVVPVAGVAAKGAKWARKSTKLMGFLGDAGKAIKRAEKAVKNVPGKIGGVIKDIGAKGKKYVDDVWRRLTKSGSEVTEKVAENTIKGGTSTLNDWVNRIPELSKQAPIEIPSSATVKAQAKNGYDQISFKWTENGQNYEVRWHTKTPGAPEGQGNTWVVSRVTPGTPTGQVRTEHILVGETWIPRYQWQDAINAYRNGTATQEQLQLLKDGHWQAP